MANVVIDDWNKEDMPMKKNSFGVWEITVPAKDGQPAIPHKSKVKVRKIASIFFVFADFPCRFQ